MSRSINELLRGLQQITNPPAGGGVGNEQELKNQDIPDMGLPKEDGEIDDEEILRDNFHLSYRLPSQPRNGAGYFLDVKPAGRMDARKEDFLMENSIDPNLIRAKVDPDSALPDLRSKSQSLMPESAKKPHNQESLIKLAHTSQLNWANRFTPTQQPQPQETRNMRQ